MVESLPVHEDIKTGSPKRDIWINNYRESLKNLAAYGIKVVTYNFMPVLDWLRTDVAHLLSDGSEALSFNKDDYAMVDLFLLRRPGAKKDYTEDRIKYLKSIFDDKSEEEKQTLFRNLLLGLPGDDTPFTPNKVLSLLEKYKRIGKKDLKENLYFFLDGITPVAEEVGIKMALHPDDPPFSVFGLPRIMCTSQDIEALMSAVPSPANGLCFCTGSYGSIPENDIDEMFDQWGSRVYFLHLRNVLKDKNGNFLEANHLEGDTDMYSLMYRIVTLMQHEKRSIPMRPDHGHKMLDDLSKITYPGYSAIGRLRGLAELRGLEYAILSSLDQLI